jgi:signal transduction histidine kinase
MTALRLSVSRLLGPDEDEPIAAHRSRRDWVADGLLFALAVAFGVVALVTSSRNGVGGTLLVVDAICGVALCLALWWRRQYPFALGLVSLPLIAVSSASGPAALVILFTVAAYCRWQRTLLLAVLQLALAPVARAVHPEGNSVAAYYLVGTLGVAALVSFGMVLRGRRQTQRESLRRAEAEQRLHIEQARHAERTRIAREMHDVLAHRISLLSLHAGALEFRPDASPDEVAAAAGVIRASAHQALEDLRAVIGLLREGGEGEEPQPPQPTLEALPGLLEESRAAGMRIHADVRVPDLGAVPETTGRHGLRIVQEALTNARKHATSAPVDLRVEGAPGVPVTAGTAPAIPGSGTGLVGLAERATLAGGYLDHGVDRDGSFSLRAWLPWPW